MISTHVSIITPMSRVENFNIIYQSIIAAMSGLDLTWEWLITVDATVVPDELNGAIANTWVGAYPTVNITYPGGHGISGNLQRNNSKAHVTGNWIKMLDDDNIMHPRYFQVVLPFMQNYPDHIIVVNQINHDGRLRLIATAENMRVGGVDHDQGIFPAYTLDDWIWEPYDYCSDGVLYESRYKLYPDKFLFINENLSWYNKLRPNWPKDHIR